MFLYAKFKNIILLNLNMTGLPVPYRNKENKLNIYLGIYWLSHKLTLKIFVISL